MRCSCVSSFTVCEIVCCSVTFGEALRSVGAKVTNSFVPRQNTHRLVLAGFLPNPPYEIGVSLLV
jgi:hypothetical protein